MNSPTAEEIRWAIDRAKTNGAPSYVTLVDAYEEAIEALWLAAHSHNVMLPTDPPQDAWKARRVDDKIWPVLAKAKELEG